MAKALKRMMVAEYAQALESVDGLVLFDPGPMTVEANQEFRKDLREKAGGAEMRVIHNRTARIALEERFFGSESAVLDEALQGPSAIVFGGGGPIPIAKVLREWRRKLKKLRIKAGVAEGEVLDAKEASDLADLPGADELRAMLLSTVIGPARGIAVSLQAVYGGIVRAVQAHVDQEGDGEASDEAGKGGSEGE